MTSAASPMRARVPLPDPNAMGADQRAVYDSILASRPSIQGPFLAWLHRPALAGPAERLGAYCRFGSALTLAQSERLILMTAVHFDCPAEWAIHRPIAEAAGVPIADIADIQAGRAPAYGELHDQALARFALELLQTNRIADDTFAAAQAALGLDALIDAAAIIGYYSLAAMTLNAFDMRPGGASTD